MTMKAFIRQNREHIDRVIKLSTDPMFRINDEERRQWILNDEGLYSWAKESGVKV